TPAIWRVIHRSMAVMGVIAQVDQPILDAARGLGSGRNAQAERPSEKVGEDGDDVDREHHSIIPSGGSMRTTRAARSTDVTTRSSMPANFAMRPSLNARTEAISSGSGRSTRRTLPTKTRRPGTKTVSGSSV